MWYLITLLVLSVWVIIDANKRKMNPLLWVIGTLLISPIVVPIYFAKRPLLTGETREGGIGWNILKNFVFVWTFIMFACAVAGIINVGQHVATNPASSEFEQAGQGLGMMLGMGMIGAIWFFPVFGALTLGFFLKKRNVEKGSEPESTSEKQAKTSGTYIASWVVLGIFALLVLVRLFSDVSNHSTQEPSAMNTPQQRHELSQITLEKFNNLKDGMNYKQAVVILGKEGELISENTIAGYKTSMYQWSEGLSNMNAMFQNGKLVQKSQFGLK